jgi:RES domain-containing protein
MILSPDKRIFALKDAEAIHVFRIVKAKYASNPLHFPTTGHRPNRWNSENIPMMYFAASPSLAALEMQGAIADFGPYGLFRMFRVRIPTRCLEVLPDAEYPTDWKTDPHPISTQTLGSAWQKGRNSLGLLIRSARSPLEYNLLINPDHPDLSQMQIEETFDHPLHHLDDQH